MQHEILENSVRRLTQFLKGAPHRQTVCITGAGISTEHPSSIPDYRGPEGIYNLNKNYKSITYQEFISQPAFRQRYWARSFYGWPKMAQSVPNSVHVNLIKLMQYTHSPLSHIITQNVDGLLQQAATQHLGINLQTSTNVAVTELHGSLRHVSCLSCQSKFDRRLLQEHLVELNPGWKEQPPLIINQRPSSNDSITSEPARLGPDGDAEIGLDQLDKFRTNRETLGVRELMGVQEKLDPQTKQQEAKDLRLRQRPDGDMELGRDISSFKYPACYKCKVGILKPDVVFFGENLSPTTRREAIDAVSRSSQVLVIGSSLQVYSAYMLVRQAVRDSKHVFLLNFGETRADDLVTQKVYAKAGPILSKVTKEFVT